MPLPKVKKDESEQDFVSRCMQDKHIQKDFKDQKQKLGVCYSIYKQHKKKKAKGSDNPYSDIDIIVIE